MRLTCHKIALSTKSFTETSFDANFLARWGMSTSGKDVLLEGIPDEGTRFLSPGSRAATLTIKFSWMSCFNFSFICIKTTSTLWPVRCVSFSKIAPWIKFTAVSPGCVLIILVAACKITLEAHSHPLFISVSSKISPSVPNFLIKMGTPLDNLIQRLNLR